MCNVELDQLIVTVGDVPGVATVEWGFTADHPSEDGIYFEAHKLFHDLVVTWIK